MIIAWALGARCERPGWLGDVEMGALAVEFERLTGKVALCVAGAGRPVFD